MKLVKEKDLEQAFLRVMNKSKEALLIKQEMMSLVRDNKEDAEIDILRGLMDVEAEMLWRNGRIEDKAYLVARDKLLDRFDGDLFRKLLEKIKVRSMVKVKFVFKRGLR